MGEPKLTRTYVQHPAGTTLVRLYPRGTSFRRAYYTEPVFEIWRDPDGNIIDPTEDQRRRDEKYRGKLGMTEDFD